MNTNLLNILFNKISDISLLLPENKKEASLNEILNNYFSGEKVEFEYKCKNCNKIVQHLKYIRFSILPKILIISLQRIDVLNKKKWYKGYFWWLLRYRKFYR